MMKDFFEAIRTIIGVLVMIVAFVFVAIAFSIAPELIETFWEAVESANEERITNGKTVH